MMEDREKMLPSEIRKFTISKPFFKGILEARINGKIRSLKIENGKAKITISNDLLEKATGERYGREIDSIEFDEDEIEVALSEEKMEAEEEIEKQETGENSMQEEEAKKKEEIEKERFSTKDSEELNRLERLRKTISGRQN